MGTQFPAKKIKEGSLMTFWQDSVGNGTSQSVKLLIFLVEIRAGEIKYYEVLSCSR